MKSGKWAVALLLVVAGVGSAWADRGSGHWRGHVGVHVGPYWGPGYYGSPFYSPLYSPPYYPPYSYYPPVIVERADPPVYIEQQVALPDPPFAEAAPATPLPGYWYYCSAAKGYYPYVRECPAGWQKVAPQPAAKP